MLFSIHTSAGLATACKIPTGKKTVNFLSYPAPEFSKNINIDNKIEGSKKLIVFGGLHSEYSDENERYAFIHIERNRLLIILMYAFIYG
jgi:hypothetical protein